MGQIPAEDVDATWQRVGAFDGPAMAALQKKSGRFQPELTAFALGFSSELRRDALGLTLYVMVVVYEMFRTRYVKVRKARDRVVLKHWGIATDQVGELRDGGVTREGLTLSSMSTTEPFVMQYVLDAFAERSDEDPIEISEDEFWHMVAVALTLVETLHEMAGAERRSV